MCHAWFGLQCTFYSEIKDQISYQLHIEKKFVLQHVAYGSLWWTGRVWKLKYMLKTNFMTKMDEILTQKYQYVLFKT